MANSVAKSEFKIVIQHIVVVVEIGIKLKVGDIPCLHSGYKRRS